jgi:hypothetical protein
VSVSNRRDRRESVRRVMEEAGFSPAGWRAALAVAQTLRALVIAGLVLLLVGFFVARFVGFAVVWIGLALFGGAVVLGLAMMPWRRRIDNVRWLDGTVVFRTVEPGSMGESGQRVVCQIELKPTARVVYEAALNPTARIARVSTTVGPMDTQRLVVGATMRCLIDRIDTRIVLRAFPYAEPNAPLPSGRELKFRKA